MKRILSILLVLILAVSCVSLTANAGDTAPDTDTKITPALAEALRSADPEPKFGEGPDVVVYLSDPYDTIADMPSWQQNDYAALDEYAQYIEQRNDALTYAVFEGHEERLSAYEFVDYGMQGCILIYSFMPKDIGILENSEHVKSVDVFDVRNNAGGEHGKFNAQLQVVLNTVDPDDYVAVWVHNAKVVKAVTDMPSWPEGKGSAADAAYLGKIAQAHSEYSSYLKTIDDELIAEAFAGIDDAVIFMTGFGFMVGAAVRARDLGTIASRDCVGEIEYVENRIPQPDTGDEEEMPEPVGYFREKLIRQYGITDLEHLDYEEQYRHMRIPDDTDYIYDWVLVRAFRADLAYPSALNSAVVGGRRLTASSLSWNPFEFAFGIYDANQGRFFDLVDINFDDYDDLYEVWKDLELTTPFGRIYEDSPYFDGDADGDSMVTILDATRIQRRLAGLCSKYEIVETSADVDRDGKLTILDATRIQRYKASLCELDGSPRDDDRGEYLNN